VVSALRTFKRDDFRPGTATRSLVGQFNTLLTAFGAKAAFNRIKLLFFLFKVVDIAKDRAGKDNDEKKQKIDGIDGISLGGIGMQLFDALFIAGYVLFNELPERLLVVLVFYMGELMYNDIFYHILGQFH